jgi:glycosyltransferase involved in cell wall biosynthesis
MSALHRVAVLAHGHAALSPGGAEIAGQALHDALQELPGVATLHVACVPHGHPLAEGEGIKGTQFIETAALDHFRLGNRDLGRLARLVELLSAFDPHTIHLHHVLGFGADALFALRRALPDAAIVLTLHEFIPICHREGQMLKTLNGMELCEGARPDSCNRCFPDIAPSRFLMRKAALQALFAAVDRFMAPSAFLARRYVEWGLPAWKITVLENVIAASGPASAITDERCGRRGRFAFFGQITPYKGVDVMLDAVMSLPPERWECCTLDIFGGGLERQPPQFRSRMGELMQRCSSRATYHGPYANGEVQGLIDGIDWVIVPSIWWENSPVVIQEAFRAGRPVIASNIGGMAEKVSDGVDGLTFAVGNPAALAQRMVDATSPQLWERLRRNIRPPVAPVISAQAHLDIYRTLREASSRAAPQEPVGQADCRASDLD